MSIVVLRRKVLNHNPRTAPISGNGNFSLNGKYRKHNYVGTTNLVSSNNCKSGIYGCSSGDTINKSVQTAKALFGQRCINCNGKSVSYKPVHMDTNNSHGEHIDELLERCYIKPGIYFTNTSSVDCYTKKIPDNNIKVNNNVGYNNYLRIKTARCSRQVIDDTYGRSYADYLKELKQKNKFCN